MSYSQAKIILGLTIAFGGLLSCRPTQSSVVAGVSSGASLATVVNGFLVDKNAQARREAENLRAQGSSDARYMELVANNTVGVWYGAWSGDIRSAVQAHASSALASDATAVMVVYNIPNRDCGSYSGGGIPAGQYRTWISQFAAGVGNAKAMIILEPDALTLTDCLGPQQRTERNDLLQFAITQFKQKAMNAKVYIDAGHPKWLSVSEVASRLKAAGIAQADGFALNTSNYYDNSTNISYGQQIAAIVQKNFVIDSSRNGKGSLGADQWCNPPGRGLGIVPTTKTNARGVDAFVWIKTPGESDGSCAGGPAAGQFWRQRAIELAKNASMDEPTPSQTTTQQTQQAQDPAQQQSQPPVASAPTQTQQAQPPTSNPNNVPNPWFIPTPSAPRVPALPVGPAVPAQSPSSVPSFPPNSLEKTTETSGSELKVDIKVKSNWQGGYCADLIVSNSGTKAVTTWTLVLNLNSSTMTQQWNMVPSYGSGTVTLKPAASWNMNIPAGGSVDMQGFCADSSGSQLSVASISG